MLSSTDRSIKLKIRTRRTVYFTRHYDLEIADFPVDNAEELAMGFLCLFRAQLFETITEDRVRVKLMGTRVERGKYP